MLRGVRNRLTARLGELVDVARGLGEEVEQFKPRRTRKRFAHDRDRVALADGEKVILGSTEIEAVATPGHAPAHHTFLVTDRVRGEDPWLVLTGDSLLVGDA